MEPCRTNKYPVMRLNGTLQESTLLPLLTYCQRLQQLAFDPIIALYEITPHFMHSQAGNSACNENSLLVGYAAWWKSLKASWQVQAALPVPDSLNGFQLRIKSCVSGDLSPNYREWRPHGGITFIDLGVFRTMLQSNTNLTFCYDGWRLVMMLVIRSSSSLSQLMLILPKMHGWDQGELCNPDLCPQLSHEKFRCTAAGETKARCEVIWGPC